MSRLTALSAAAGILFLAVPADAFINCAAHPLQPNCCPAPCPVMDLSELAQNVGITMAQVEEIAQWAKQLESWRTVASTIGSTATPSLSLRSQQTTPQISRRIPGFATDITQVLLTTANLNDQDRADTSARLRVANLPSLSALAPVAAAEAAAPALTAGGPDPWRGRTVARTGLYAQLVDVSAANSGLLAASLLGQTLTSGVRVVTPDATSYNPIAPARQSAFGRALDLAALMNGAISLNNAGALTGKILSSIPVLQRSVDRYNEVATAQRGNTFDLASTLGALNLFEAPETAAANILMRARQLDPSRYIDNWTSASSAAAAVATIAQTLAEHPEEFGRVLPQLPMNDGNAPAPPDTTGVAPIVDAWLGNTKYGEFLAPIAATAQRLQGTALTTTAQIAQHYPVPLTPDAIADYARAAAGQVAAQAPNTDVSVLAGIAARPAQDFLKVR